MGPFEYIALLASIILALGVTRIFTGIGRIIQLRKEVKIYWVHILWVGNVFLWLLVNWWILFRWRTFEAWSFFLFIFVLISPSIAFILSVLLLPEPIKSGMNLKNYFYNNSKSFFILATLLPLLDVADTSLKGREHLAAQGLIYPITIGLIFLLCFIGSCIKHELYHAAFAIFFLIYMVVFITINLRVLV
jgi:hypothetical protein